jgi:hypothetical protein
MFGGIKYILKILDKRDVSFNVSRFKPSNKSYFA